MPEKLKPKLSEILTDPEVLKRLAESMVEPRRCGGMDYDKDGNPRYWIKGKPYPTILGPDEPKAKS